jgi:DNA-binding NarL/FixJ family response regulator
MIDRAQRVVEQLASPEPSGVLQLNRGVLAYERGDYAAAEMYQLEACATFRALGPGTLVWYLGLLGMAQAALRKHAEARACMAELESLIAGLPPGTMPTGEPLAHLLAIALALGDRERIDTYAPRLHAFRGQYHDALVDRLLGEIAIVQADWPVAQAALAAAFAIAERGGMRPELARTHTAQARLELARGGRRSDIQAAAHLAAALALWSELGNTSEAERLSESAQPEISRLRPALPAGLSEREAQVLRLVAAGKSNRQIAQELALSEKTIANHLTNILGKTGADNRAAAAAFAIRHGLA